MRCILNKQALLLIVLLAVVSSPLLAQQKPADSQPGKAIPTAVGENGTPVASVEEFSLGSTKNVHRVGDLFLAGQFTADDIATIKAAGIERVISLRTDGEVNWDEAQAIADAGLEFDSIPLGGPETLTDDKIAETCILLKNPDGKILLHCGSAMRVGAVWLAHRVLHDQIPLAQAREEAKIVGLKSPAYEQRAIEYIEKQQALQKKSVRPGINDSFLKADLDPEEFIKKFEIESREVYSARREILKACNIQTGSKIADVGAGTGLYTRLFANQTGPSGWVYAVDISPRLLQHTLEQSKLRDQKNVTGVLCEEDSVCLPPDSVDFVFVCDTYHHFEYPESTLASIFSALKSGGRLVVVDFHRIEGKSRPWLIEHVRGGQEVFRSEIEAAGFQLVSDAAVPGLEENYFMMFEKQK